MKKLRITGIVILGLAIILGICYEQGMIHSNSGKYIKSSTPTIFFHGWGVARMQNNIWLMRLNGQELLTP